MPDSKANALREQFLVLREYMNSRILGQHRLVSRMLVALLADGHILVESLPGLAKTRAVKILASGLEAAERRHVTAETSTQGDSLPDLYPQRS
jgi:MoxR-like ATPase